MGSPVEQPPQTLSGVVERLPGSRNFSPDGTWWGYNMSKVVRRGDFVFTYVIENDDNPSTYSTFRIYAKEEIGADDEMVIAFGLHTDAEGHTEQVLTKMVGGAAWAQEAAGTRLGHDFYYPFVAVGSTGTIGILPIQDDLEGVGNPNTYQIIRFFSGRARSWAALGFRHRDDL